MNRFQNIVWYLWIGFLLVGCETRTPFPGGIAISFDDRFIEEWYELRPLFANYGAKVTFYIHGDTLTEAELKMLHELQNDGHEIAFHGTIHGDASQLLKNHGIEGYLDQEIRPGLAFFRRHGFNPTSYAHPGGTRTRKTDEALLTKGFVTLRDVAKAERYYRGIKLYHIPPAFMPHIFYRFNDRKNLYALQIDRETQLSVEEMKKAIRKAGEKGSVLMLFGHQPLPDNPTTEQYGFEIAFLKEILQEAQSAGLRFYTMSELQRPNRRSL